MKNKLRLIEVSMLSSYMGRALTGIVTLFVIVVAISAYFSGGGRGFERGVIAICINHAGMLPATADSEPVIEPLRSLLGRETRRPVVVTECPEEWPVGFDLYVMPVHEYFVHERSLDIEALFEIQSSARLTDKAVIISSEPIEEEWSPVPAADEIVFAHPMSVNGFWVQAGVLEEHGFEIASKPRDIHFSGSTAGGDRVIFNVLCGAYRYGACKLSEITNRSSDGSIAAGELHVAYAGDVLPELVIASKKNDSAYYSRGLKRIAALLDEEMSPSLEDETVGLLRSRGVRGLRPLDRGRMDEARRLFEDYGGVFDTTRVVRP